MKKSQTYKHENGYSAILYGESSMSVYYDGKEVMHTGSRSANTEVEVMKVLGNMPAIFEMVSKLTDEDFDYCDI